eukprot:7936743-Alexandrium_andersonii.AAC.1
MSRSPCRHGRFSQATPAVVLHEVVNFRVRLCTHGKLVTVCCITGSCLDVRGEREVVFRRPGVAGGQAPCRDAPDPAGQRRPLEGPWPQRA